MYKKDKCCCTIGRAWGFGCSHCPKPGTPAFDELCPKGYGFIDNVDVNECLAFPDMCQNGRCKNTLGDYNCRCNQGYAIDKHEITCSNIDECAIMKGEILHSALKLEKKVQFHKYKNTIIALSKMAKNQFLHQKKV